MKRIIPLWTLSLMIISVSYGSATDSNRDIKLSSPANGKIYFGAFPDFGGILNNPHIKFQAINPWHEDWQNEDDTWTRIRLDSSTDIKVTFRKWIGDERFISEVH